MRKAEVVNIQRGGSSDISYADYDITILAEGDSWFSWGELNLMPSSNILEQLRFPKRSLVVNYAYAGDTTRRIVDFFTNGAFFVEMRSQRYSAILLSGGGNDLIDALYDPTADKPLILKRSEHSDPSSPNAYIDAEALDRLMHYISANFKAIFDYRKQEPAANLHTPIFLHTYDYPTPRNAPAELLGHPMRGPWLLPALVAVNAPEQLYNDITRLVFDRLAETLLSLADESEGIYVVDTRASLAPAADHSTGSDGDWLNEIHPNIQGYEKIAARIAAEIIDIREAVPSMPMPPVLKAMDKTHSLPA
ncbi:SGNH/GDSL hydrolase family protein [Noviherbaspirillum malthae]|jgi:lysophospholipase L1-like esterase|uniref:SGNH/GDSL hydrolase family protein n=1 Tax=Noviherbaspirillum malthae TaxID=1260987 RepID=UPI001890ACCE|nr:SGNH/GDSL hydrolase family protein [Noviherbaspirillum malthae]